MKMASGDDRVLPALVAGLIGTLIVSIIGAVSTHFMALHFGPEQFGILTLGASLATTAAGLTEFGQTQMLQRDIANSPDRESEFIAVSLGLRLTLAFLSFCLFSILGLALYAHQGRNASATIIASLGALPLMAAAQTLSVHFLNNFRNRRLVELSVMQQLLNLGGVLLAIRLGVPIVWCAVSTVATSALQCVTLYLIVHRQLKIRPKVDRSDWWERLRIASPLGLAALLGSFYLKVDILILGILGESSLIGYYGIAISASSFFLVLPGLLARVFMPVISKPGEDGRRASIDMLSYAWSIGSLSVVLVYLGAPVTVRIFAGNHFEASIAPLRILGVSVLCILVGSCLAAYCVAKGIHQRLWRLTGIMLLSNIVLNLIAIPIFGIVGSAWATTACEFSGLFVLTRLIWKNAAISFRSLQRPWPSLVSGALAIAAGLPLLTGFTQSLVAVCLAEIIAFVVFSLALLLLGGLPLGVLYFIFPGKHHARSGLIARCLLRSDWTRQN
jgi:O-antigen/teichoic acid export membrane protein